MFKLPQLPSRQAGVHELADFAELLSWQSGSASKREIVAYLGRNDENDDNIGCNDNEDKASDYLDEVMLEIECRSLACGSGYPFKLELGATVLRYVPDTDAHRGIIYRYLLLSTRLNMSACRIHDGIDGADLLENLSAHALKNYLGGTRARSLVFGTAAAGGFGAKVDSLCRELGEGGRYRPLDDAVKYAQDCKLDAVAWVPFTDSLPGQVIIFGQCKTGTEWKDHVAQLQPESFCKKCMTEHVLHHPIRAFCLSESVSRSAWKSLCADAGIVLDRCRLVDFCDDPPSDLLHRIGRWTEEAIKLVDLR